MKNEWSIFDAVLPKYLVNCRRLFTIPQPYKPLQPSWDKPFPKVPNEFLKGFRTVIRGEKCQYPHSRGCANATALDIGIDAVQRTLEFVVCYSVNQMSQFS
jgi:hypothetical protein